MVQPQKLSHDLLYWYDPRNMKARVIAVIELLGVLRQLFIAERWRVLHTAEPEVSVLDAFPEPASIFRFTHLLLLPATNLYCLLPSDGVGLPD